MVAEAVGFDRCEKYQLPEPALCSTCWVEVAAGAGWVEAGAGWVEAGGAGSFTSVFVVLVWLTSE